MTLTPLFKLAWREWFLWLVLLKRRRRFDTRRLTIYYFIWTLCKFLNLWGQSGTRSLFELYLWFRSAIWRQWNSLFPCCFIWGSPWWSVDFPHRDLRTRHTCRLHPRPGSQSVVLPGKGNFLFVWLRSQRCLRSLIPTSHILRSRWRRLSNVTRTDPSRFGSSMFLFEAAGVSRRRFPTAWWGFICMASRGHQEMMWTRRYWRTLHQHNSRHYLYSWWIF